MELEPELQTTMRNIGKWLESAEFDPSGCHCDVVDDDGGGDGDDDYDDEDDGDEDNDNDDDDINRFCKLISRDIGIFGLAELYYTEMVKCCANNVSCGIGSRFKQPLFN